MGLKDRIVKKYDLADELEFVELAIKTLRKVDSKSKGIHSTWSGLNSAFCLQFGCTVEQMIETFRQLHQDQKIYQRPSKKGAMVYLWKDRPSERITPEEVLKKMGLTKG